ncbi:aminoglycoside 3-N-acetyltransferase [Salinarimonas soli]|uniref:Aminoglycoside N(3)-acetyltransferase n=1 Tax=Salinarimonas soli TaxID=1638099 RepID=A0A5B2VD20_9HYPH|nr:aminoglycoside 3-N-acetyltransferase [Salinarimonas soli]KAA2237383.1 aminoglycoside 3-N-acetyltransferase [Salinarimonas soli]
MTTTPLTRAALRRDLAGLGVERGDIVMVHAAMSRLGRLLNGPDAFIAALLDAVGPTGTILAYTDWDGAYDDLLDGEGRVAPAWRDHVPPFDPATSRAVRDNGVLAEFVRTTPGARRSGNPGASVAAIGAQADWLTADHPLDFGYGEGSPLARLVEAGGKVLMAGAPLDTMTLLHHAEHLARVPGKRLRRYEAPILARGTVEWRMIEEFDTSDPIVPGLAEDFFGAIVREFLACGHGRQGMVGRAPSVLVDAAAICAFAVAWIERHATGLGAGPGA